MRYISDKETLEYRDHTITVEWYRDEDMREPWKECDGHGIVSDWTSRDKYSGERVLVSDSHGRSKRYYDVEATTKLAKKDGWGLSDEALFKLTQKLGRRVTKGEVIAAAVEADFQYLSDWCNDRWEWKIRSVRIKGTSYRDSLGGIDGTDETIKTYTEEAFTEAKAWLDNELSESQDAACRDIVTEGAR